MTLQEIIWEAHARLGNAAFYYAAIMTLWGFWRILKKRAVDSNYWGAIVIAEILILLQGALGVYLYFFSEFRLARQVHILYGIVSALVLPAAFAYTRGNQERRDMIIYGAVFLILTVLTARALMTAGMVIVIE
ncbi:MAG: hypothetical protein RML93_09095 [Anaerolineales bacterium]|nr:hypothetical protein [Anaerolineales bacterium]MCS7247914.1 hypothetical protein [Anaerolineales bacterium]MDW8161724.1 hypothetical protein [Anaerolineales bacterium]MDW8447429.1 hypothetical protein [Anaerolineales bacterium]